MKYVFAVLVLIISIALVVQAAPAVRKIVVFDPAVVNEPAQEALVKAVGGTILKDLPLITGKAVFLPPQAEAALGRMPGVVRIDPDVIVEAYGKPVPPPPPAETLPWGVDRIDAALAWSTSTGSGVKVAIVDTGIDLDHPDLQANIAGNVNIINSTKTGDDDNGHGTHVAGTVAAVDNDIGVIGVAPAANLYAVKVLDRKGNGFLSDVIAGLNWCKVHGMQVVNMSLGTSSDIQSFHDAVIAVNAVGIIQVAAAGNASGSSVNYPAAYEEVIAVSAIDSTNTIAYFSSVGPQVELAAPGVGIPSTWKGGGYNTISGTSMAAPHVTGTVALVIAAGVTDVRIRLQQTADDLGTTGRDIFYGYGLVDAEEAATGSQTHLAPRHPGVPVSKLSTTWGELKSK